jgi:hypothetical protein
VEAWARREIFLIEDDEDGLVGQRGILVMEKSDGRWVLGPYLHDGALF